MPKSGEIGSPKWISKQLKKKGLDKLKFYCQCCQKQCRDANGYKLHIVSPSHISKEQQHSQNNTVLKWSQQFEGDFVYTLKSLSRDNPITANRVYNELIRDKSHVHLNSTRWRSLSAFINHLQHKNVVKVLASEPELVIVYRDLTKEELRKRKADEAKVKSEHERNVQKEMLEAQIARSEEKCEVISEYTQSCPDNVEKSIEPMEADNRSAKISFSLKKKK